MSMYHLEDLKTITPIKVESGEEYAFIKFISTTFYRDSTLLFINWSS